MSTISWRAQLKSASFRGVNFFVDSGETKLGRRTVQHDYPLRDQAYVEDLGARANEFTIEAYVLASVIVNGVRGGDYFAARDALRAALTKAGPGPLVHPYLGTRNVMLTEATLRESTAEGGIARFTLTFVESGDNLQPDSATDTAAAVDGAAAAAEIAAQDDFAQKFAVMGEPQFVSDDAAKNFNNFITQLRTTSGQIAGAASPITQFSAQLDQLSSGLTSLMGQPANLAADVTGAIIALAGVATSTRAALDSYRSLSSFGSSLAPIATPTASRTQQAANQTATVALVQRSATIESARAASQTTFDSYDDAQAIQQELADRLDGLMENASDEVYLTLMDLRAAMVRDLSVRAASLPRLVRYTPPATVPALVLAYQLYGDAMRADEIIARNRIAHPLFVPGGVPLEVLADG